MIHFTLRAHAPRTKKTHQRIVQIKAKGGGRGFTKVLPSEAHEAWFKATLQECLVITAELRRQIELPIAHDLNCAALFYRDANTGDAVGYYQALADILQEQIVKDGKVRRKGAGIILDDRQIVQWDGSRLLKDAADPRIEVTLTVVKEQPVPGDTMDFGTPEQLADMPMPQPLSKVAAARRKIDKDSRDKERS